MNSNYNFDRIPNKNLILRWNGSTSDTEIDLTLVEPFKIDTLCDIYLDNFTTYHGIIGNPADHIDFSSEEMNAFVLNINEFNIKSNIAGTITSSSDDTNSLFNNIIIPVEGSDLLNYDGTNIVRRTHKGRKMNYVCSINPTKISKITGSITNLNGGPIFNQDSNSSFIAEFVFVKRK